MTQTIFTWQSELTALLIITVSVTVAYLSASDPSAAMTAKALGITLVPPALLVDNPPVPGEWLD